MTTDRQAFLARIRAEPDEDTHRLVFADWLDEYGTEPGDAAWARVIRLQVAAADNVGLAPRVFQPVPFVPHPNGYPRHSPLAVEVALPAIVRRPGRIVLFGPPATSGYYYNRLFSADGIAWSRGFISIVATRPSELESLADTPDEHVLVRRVELYTPRPAAATVWLNDVVAAQLGPASAFGLGPPPAGHDAGIVAHWWREVDHASTVRDPGGEYLPPGLFRRLPEADSVYLPPNSPGGGPFAYNGYAARGYPKSQAADDALRAAALAFVEARRLDKTVTLLSPPEPPRE